MYQGFSFSLVVVGDYKPDLHVTSCLHLTDKLQLLVSVQINYASAHDNETLFDIIMLKVARGVTLDERLRLNHLATSIVALSQVRIRWLSEVGSLTFASHLDNGPYLACTAASVYSHVIESRFVERSRLNPLPSRS